MAYHINCQYRVHFQQRMRDLGWSPPFTIHAIGKCHLYAHKDSCRGAYSFNYIPGSGRTDGEESERGWSTRNGLAASTREMSSGHRHDVLNDHSSDINFRKMHAIGTHFWIMLYLSALTKFPTLHTSSKKRVTCKFNSTTNWRR